MRLDPAIPANTYHDGFGNFCHVIRAPAGRLTMSTDFLVRDKGEPDAIAPQAEQHALENLPVEVLIYLLGSRYCETDRLSNTAWSLFGKVPRGWPLVKAICDYVHEHITFGYQHASPTKTAWDVHTERRGVCRDFAHLAVTLCRCMNVMTAYRPPVQFPDQVPGRFSEFITHRRAGGHCIATSGTPHTRTPRVLETTTSA
jgi:transglutaminase-like putative cysteine protease